MEVRPRHRPKILKVQYVEAAGEQCRRSAGAVPEVVTEVPIERGARRVSVGGRRRHLGTADDGVALNRHAAAYAAEALWEGSISSRVCFVGAAWLAAERRVEGAARRRPKSASAVLELVESDLPPAQALRPQGFVLY